MSTPEDKGESSKKSPDIVIEEPVENEPTITEAAANSAVKEPMKSIAEKQDTKKKSNEVGHCFVKKLRIKLTYKTI